MRSSPAASQHDALPSADKTNVPTRSDAYQKGPQKFRKPRCDCVLDARLSFSQAADLSRRLDHGLSVREASRWLKENHGISLSSVSVSRWAARRRRQRTEITIASLVQTVFADRKRIRKLDAQSPQQMQKANEMLVHHALFTAFLNKDQTAIRHAAAILEKVTMATFRQGRLKATERRAERQLESLFGVKPPETHAGQPSSTNFPAMAETPPRQREIGLSRTAVNDYNQET